MTAIPTISALYCTAASCGLRPGELMGLPDDAVDLAVKVMRIEQGLARAGRDPVLADPKTATGTRQIGIPDELLPILRRAIAWKKEQRLRLGPKFRDTGLLFCGPKGRPFNPSNIRNRDHYPRLKRLGLPKTRPQDFRHFDGSELVAANVDPRTVADRLGHSRASFTIDTYAHARRKPQEKAVAVASTLLVQLAPVAQ